MHARGGSSLAVPRLKSLDASPQSELDIPSPAPRDEAVPRMQDEEENSNFTSNTFHDGHRLTVLNYLPVNTVLATPSPKRPQRRRHSVASPMNSSGTARTEIFSAETQLMRRVNLLSRNSTPGREDIAPSLDVRSKTMSPPCRNSRSVEGRQDTTVRINAPGTHEEEPRGNSLDIRNSGQQKLQRGYREEYDELLEQYRSLRDQFSQLQLERQKEEPPRQPAPCFFASPAPSVAQSTQCASPPNCPSAASTSSVPQLVNWFSTNDDSTIVVDITVESTPPHPQPTSKSLPNSIADARPRPTPAPSSVEVDANSSIRSWLASVEPARKTSTAVADAACPPDGSTSATMRGLLRAVTSLENIDSFGAKRCTEPLIPPLALGLCRALRPHARQLLLVLVREAAGGGGTVTPTMCTEAINDVLAAAGVRDVRATRHLCSCIAAVCEGVEMEAEADGRVRRVPYASFIAQVMQLAEEDSD